MNQMWSGPSATGWTAIGAIATAVGVIVAVGIAWLVQRASSRSSQESRRVIQSLAELIRRGRRNDLLTQLRVSSDPELLRMLVDEGRLLVGGCPAERIAVEKAYFTNPAAPLLNYRHQFPDDLGERTRRDLLNAVIEALPERFPDGSPKPARMAEEFAHFTRLSLELNANTYHIASLVVDRSKDSWSIDDNDIRNILHPPGGYACEANMEAASDYLYRLMHTRPPTASLVNVLADVSLAIWDCRSTGRQRMHSHSALTAYVMLMPRALDGIGKHIDETGMTLSVDHAIAVMTHAVGLCAGDDDHLNMRAAEALNPVLASFSTDRFTPHGIVADQLVEGTQLLLDKYPDGPLADSLRQEVKRLTSRA